MKQEYTVNFIKDNEAGVWVATSEDVPGLVLESESMDTLMERVSYAIPELLEMAERPEVQKFAQVYM